MFGMRILFCFLVISECVKETVIGTYIEKNRKISKKLMKRPEYMEICKLLSSILKQNIELHLYGSRIYGTGNEDSDLNIFIDFSEYTSFIWFHFFDDLVKCFVFARASIPRNESL